MILFLFLAHLGVGIVFTLVLVSREAGVKFFRFNAGLAAILIAVAFAFRPPATSRPVGDASRSSRSPSPKLARRRVLGDRRPDAGVDSAGDRGGWPSAADAATLVAAGARASSRAARCRCRC